MKGRKGVFAAWAAGTLGFIIPQLLIRIPVLQFLVTLPEIRQFTETYPYIYVLLLALTAGLFESAGRLLVLKILLRKKLSYMAGLASGAGHGSIEAILLTGLTYVNNLIVSFFINAGLLKTIIPNNPAMEESIRQAILGTPSYMFLIGGLERIFTMMLHAALSVLLVYFILNRRAVLGFFTITLIHFAVDFSAGLMQILKVNPLVIEGVIMLAALLSLGFIIRIRSSFGDSLSIPITSDKQ